MSLNFDPPAKEFSFGPFRFLPEQQQLLKDGMAVRLGRRALEILHTLVERPGQLVPKDELLSRVWPGLHVGESNLKVNVAALRRALDEDFAYPRYIATVSGRGYRFVAPVSVSSAAGSVIESNFERHNLPIQNTRIFGQKAAIAELDELLDHSRLLTITGPGGIGKTTVALAVAWSALQKFENGVWFVDLAPVIDPALVSSKIATTLGLSIHSSATTAAIVSHLADKHILLVLDNCEHVVGAAAELASQLAAETSDVHILATSREALRVPSETIFRLPALETPPAGAHISASGARDFSAIELFIDRAMATTDAPDFVLNDATAPLIGIICRNLDGIALAIELAAARVRSLGLGYLTTALTDRVQIFGHNDRSLPARHQTLQATLDWSYQLLGSSEQGVLQRLSLFAGLFNLKGAISLAAFGSISTHEVLDSIDDLAAKSLISVSADTPPQYRLLAATRTFARGKLLEGGTFTEAAERHAEYIRDALKLSADAIQLDRSGVLEQHLPKLDDVRAALKWAFSSHLSRALALALVIEAIPMWSRLSLLDECRQWVEQALATHSAHTPIEDHQLMVLCGAFGSTSFYTQGAGPQVEAALFDSLRLAEQLGDTSFEMRLLWKLAYYFLYKGKHANSLALATRLQSVAIGAKDAAAQRDGDRTVAAALHYMGNHTRARQLLENYIDDNVMLSEGPRLARFQLDHRVSFHATLAHILFVQGMPDQALQSVEIGINEALSIGHPLSLGSILVLAAVPVSLYRGELDQAERFLAILMELVTEHGLAFWNAMTRCLYNAVLMLKGEQGAVDSLSRATTLLRSVDFGVRYPAFLGFLARGLGASGRQDEAIRTIEIALRWSDQHQELWSLPELRRIKGGLLLSGSPADRKAAEAELLSAVDLARSQDALSWELRAGTDLARLWHARGRTGEARELLQSIYDRFTEGFDTKDLREARAVLSELASP